MGTILFLVFFIVMLKMLLFKKTPRTKRGDSTPSGKRKELDIVDDLFY